jgi:hypothetical protein
LVGPLDSRTLYSLMARRAALVLLGLFVHSALSQLPPWDNQVGIALSQYYGTIEVSSANTLSCHLDIQFWMVGSNYTHRSRY